jgi:hypothetical protein
MKSFHSRFDDKPKKDDESQSKPGKYTPKTIKELEQQVSDMKLVDRCAAKLGLRLIGCHSDKTVEIYTDIYRGENNPCFLLKVWSDSWFRLNTHIYIDKITPNFKQRFYKIYMIGADNLFSVYPFEGKGEHRDKMGVEFGMEIFKAGFNAKVLKKVVETFEKILEETKPLL